MWYPEGYVALCLVTTSVAAALCFCTLHPPKREPGTVYLWCVESLASDVTFTSPSLFQKGGF